MQCRCVATQPVDVEHRRPKGAVEVEVVDAKGNRKVRKARGTTGGRRVDEPAPSCIDCNRQRQQVPDAEPGSACSARATASLRDERRRASLRLR